MKINELAAYAANGGEAAAGQTQERLSQLGKSKDPAAIDKAARDFEAYFVQNMLQQMRKTIPHSGLLERGQADAIFESMLDESIGKAVSEGRGIGLADHIRRHMLGDGEDGQPAHLPIAPPAAPFSAGYSSAMAAHMRQILPPGGQVTSGFGARLHPMTGELHFHSGIDIAMPEGTPVRAAGPGTVVFAGESEGYGNLVVVEHADGYTTRYAHNSTLLVEAGQQVDASTQIAESGSTGNSTGPHLHFEVRKDGVAVDPRKTRWARLP